MSTRAVCIPTVEKRLDKRLKKEYTYDKAKLERGTKMDTVLNKLNGFKKIIYFVLCGLYALLYFCTFIYYVTNDAGIGNTFAQLTTGFGVCAILTLGLLGIILNKEKLSSLAFALILGTAIYGLIAGFFSGMQVFDYFDYYGTTAILYYVFAFLTDAVGTAFAVFAVLTWLIGREALRKVTGIIGIVWIGMTCLMIIFTIIVVADGWGWTNIIEAFYDVARNTFVVVLATTGVIGYTEIEAKKAEKPAAPAEKKAEEQPAETAAD